MGVDFINLQGHAFGMSNWRLSVDFVMPKACPYKVGVVQYPQKMSYLFVNLNFITL